MFTIGLDRRLICLSLSPPFSVTSYLDIPERCLSFVITEHHQDLSVKVALLLGTEISSSTILMTVIMPFRVVNLSDISPPFLVLPEQACAHIASLSYACSSVAITPQGEIFLYANQKKILAYTWDKLRSCLDVTFSPKILTHGPKVAGTGFLIASPTGHFLYSGGSDGIVSIRGLNSVLIETPIMIQTHSYYPQRGGGIGCVTFDMSSVLSFGRGHTSDLVCYSFTPTQSLVKLYTEMIITLKTPSLSVKIFPSIQNTSDDIPNNIAPKITVLNSIIANRLHQMVENSSASNRLYKQVVAIENQLHLLLKTNHLKPDIEKVSIVCYVVNIVIIVYIKKLIFIILNFDHACIMYYSWKEKILF